jgi:hypothetical protein
VLREGSLPRSWWFATLGYLKILGHEDSSYQDIEGYSDFAKSISQYRKILGCGHVDFSISL